MTRFGFFDYLLPFIDSFYLIKFDIFGLPIYPPLLVNLVCEQPLMAKHSLHFCLIEKRSRNECYSVVKMDEIASGILLMFRLVQNFSPQNNVYLLNIKDEAK